jgi:hypothetical protein
MNHAPNKQGIDNKTMKNIKELTDFYMWMVENEYDHNIRIRVEKKAEMYLKSIDVGQGIPTRNFLCYLLGHKYRLKKHITSYLREIKCTRCKQEFGMNDQTKSVLPLDKELKELHATL